MRDAATELDTEAAAEVDAAPVEKVLSTREILELMAEICEERELAMELVALAAAERA